MLAMLAYYNTCTVTYVSDACYIHKDWFYDTFHFKFRQNCNSYCVVIFYKIHSLKKKTTTTKEKKKKHDDNKLYQTTNFSTGPNKSICRRQNKCE